MDKKQLSSAIKNEAFRLGFQDIGIAKAMELTAEAKKLEAWLHKGMHGKMTYMENHFDMRIDPRKLVPNAQSVIVLSYNYFTEKKQADTSAPKLSTYAYGEDYHIVLKTKLKQLLEFIKNSVGEISGRCFVDSAPVLERAWAQRSGVGWVGKNGLVLTKRKGSYFFLSEIILDVELDYDIPVKDYCGTCTKCIDACPTDAIVAPHVVDGSKCISYFTIELKDAVLPTEMKNKFQNWMFGCDVCQQVCPINAAAVPHQEPLFEPNDALLSMTRKEWIELTEDVFQTLFAKSPVKRTKYEGLKRNIDFLT